MSMFNQPLKKSCTLSLTSKLIGEEGCLQRPKRGDCIVLFIFLET